MTQRHPRKEWPAHLAYIRELSCLACGDNTSTEAAHIRMGCEEIGKRQTGKGEKPDDIYTVPLCGKCHREQHQTSEEKYWQSRYRRGLMPWTVKHWLFLKALALACASGDHEMGEKIVKGDLP